LLAAWDQRSFRRPDGDIITLCVVAAGGAELAAAEFDSNGWDIPLALAKSY
jgi:hypothetical protein